MYETTINMQCSKTWISKFKECLKENCDIFYIQYCVLLYFWNVYICHLCMLLWDQSKRKLVGIFIFVKLWQLFNELFFPCYHLKWQKRDIKSEQTFWWKEYMTHCPLHVFICLIFRESVSYLSEIAKMTKKYCFNQS